MNYNILPNNNLKIFWDINNYKEIISDLQEKDPQWYYRDSNLWDFFENLFCDSELDQIDPLEIAALTSSPILGIRDQNDTIIRVWWYPNYAIASPLEDLIKDGFTIFQSGNID